MTYSIKEQEFQILFLPLLVSTGKGGVFCQVLLVQRQKLNCYPPFPPLSRTRSWINPEHGAGLVQIGALDKRLSPTRGLTAAPMQPNRKVKCEIAYQQQQAVPKTQIFSVSQLSNLSYSWLII